MTVNAAARDRGWRRMSSAMIDGLEIVRASEEHIDDIVEVENLSFKIPWSAVDTARVPAQ